MLLWVFSIPFLLSFFVYSIANIPPGGMALLDEAWIDQTTKHAEKLLEKLDTDLKSFKSCSIKESVRWHFQLLCYYCCVTFPCHILYCLHVLLFLFSFANRCVFVAVPATFVGKCYQRLTEYLFVFAMFCLLFIYCQRFAVLMFW